MLSVIDAEARMLQTTPNPWGLNHYKDAILLV